MQISCFCLNSHPLTLAPSSSRSGGSCLQQLALLMVLLRSSPVPSFFDIYYENSAWQVVFSSPFSLAMFVSVWTLILLSWSYDPVLRLSTAPCSSSGCSKLLQLGPLTPLILILYPSPPFPSSFLSTRCSRLIWIFLAFGRDSDA